MFQVYVTLKPRRQRFRASTCPSQEHRLSLDQLVLLSVRPSHSSALPGAVTSPAALAAMVPLTAQHLILLP